jgi:hypothetical protein
MEKYEEIKSIIKENPYGFFTISFIKADGTNRVLNGRCGVSKGLVGKLATTKYYPNYLRVFDCTKKEYRNVNLDTVYELKANRKVYTF